MSKSRVAFPHSFLFLLITFFTISISHGEKSTPPITSAPKLLVLKFHADWCGSCRAMGPVLKDLQNKMDGKPILFSTFDRTNQSTSHQAQMLAYSLGTNHIYEQNPGTGFLLVVDSKSKKVLARMTKKQGLKDMSKTIQEFL